MASKAAGEKQQTVDLSTLSTENLSAVKKQLDDELEHLTNSYTKLRQAQAKFRECIKSVKVGVASGVEGKTILVPLTTSLYVPGTLASTETVLLDIGTGYYVEKSTADAEKFYNAKIETLTTNLGDLDKIIGQKSQNLRTIEEVLRHKMLGGQGPSSSSG